MSEALVNRIYEIITKDMYVNDYGEWVLPKDKDMYVAVTEAIAALSHEGMVMVPREPTPEMIEAFIDKALKSDDYSYGLKIADPVAGYRAMIAASPSLTNEGERG